MTLSTTSNKIPYPLASGINTTGMTYTFPFRVVLAADLVVTAINLVSGLESTLVLNRDYTVVGLGVYTGGSITLLDDWEGNTLWITRVVSLTQETGFASQGAFFPEIHESAFDKLTMVAQQHEEELGRTLEVPVGASVGNLVVVPQPSAYLGWDAFGNLVNLGQPVQTAVGATTIKYLSNYPSFAAAIAAIGSSPTKLIIDTSAAVTVNTTVPATCQIECAYIGGFVISSGVTLTIYGPFHCGLHQCFSGLGTVLFQQGSNSGLRPEWWAPSTCTDWSVPINKAILANVGVNVVTAAPGFSVANGVGGRVLLAARKYPCLFPIRMTDKTSIAGASAQSIITTAAGFQGSAVIVNYNDFVGSVTGSVLTVTQMNAGSVNVGDYLSSGTWNPGSAGATPAVPPNITIASNGTGTGGQGTYNLSASISGGVASQPLQTTPYGADGFCVDSLKLRDLQVWDTVGIAGLMGVCWIRTIYNNDFADVVVADFQRSGVKLDQCYNVNFKGVDIVQCATAGGAGTVWVTCTQANVDHSCGINFHGCNFEGDPYGVAAIQFEHCGGGFVTGCIFEDNTYGVTVMDCQSIIVDRNYMEDIQREFVTLQYNGVSNSTGCEFKNNELAGGAYVYPVCLSGCIGTVVDNCTCATTGVPMVFNGTLGSQPTASRTVVRNCSSGLSASGDSQGFREVLWDDFFGASLNTNLWTVSGTGGSAALVGSGPTGGVVRLTCIATASDIASLCSGNGFTSLLYAKSNPVIEVRARLNTLAYALFEPIRLSGSSQFIRIYAQDSATTGTSIALDVYNGTDSQVNTLINIDTNWHVYRLEIAPNAVLLYIDGILKATVTTNIPTVALTAYHQITALPGVNGTLTMDLDYVSIKMDRTVAP